MIKQDDTPLPDRKKLTEALKAAEFAKMNNTSVAAGLYPEQMEEIVEGAKWALHAIPPELDFIDVITRNPLNQVYFRAGLLACREYMARFVEQGGDATTAASIRANWWPHLGPDPGPPRLFDFAELCDEIELPDGGAKWEAKQMSASIEALPRALGFLTT